MYVCVCACVCICACVYTCVCVCLCACYIAIASFSPQRSLLSVAIWHLLSGMEGSSPPARVSDARVVGGWIEELARSRIRILDEARSGQDRWLERGGSQIRLDLESEF